LLCRLADEGDECILVDLPLMTDRGNENGEGVAKDPVTVSRLQMLAATQGDAGAQYSQGSLYFRGEGVPQDYVQAARLWRLAAEQGYADAQYCLGSLYTEGKGVIVRRDHVEAARLFGLAAAQGHRSTILANFTPTVSHQTPKPRNLNKALRVEDAEFEPRESKPLRRRQPIQPRSLQVALRHASAEARRMLRAQPP
jgi:TPR repeat protein